MQYSRGGLFIILPANFSRVDKVYCGQAIPGEEIIRQSVISNKKKYNDFQHDLGGFLHDFKEQSNQTWESFRDGLGGTFDEIVR